MVKCPICGIERNALYKHLNSEHHISVKEFRKLFPNCPTEDKNVISNLHNSQVRRWSKTGEREKASIVSKKMWENEDYRSKSCKSRVDGAKKQWKDKESRDKRIKSIRKAQSNLWKNEDYRKNQVESFKNKWKDEEYRNKMLKRFSNIKEYKRSDGSIVKMRSTYEVTCSEYLDGLNIEYIYEKHPYTIKEPDGKISHYIPDFYISKSKFFIEVKSNYYFNKGKDEILYRVKYMKDVYGFNVYLAKDWELKNITNFKKFLIKNGCADTLINPPQNGRSLDKVEIHE